MSSSITSKSNTRNEREPRAVVGSVAEAEGADVAVVAEAVAPTTSIEARVASSKVARKVVLTEVSPTTGRTAADLEAGVAACSSEIALNAVAEASPSKIVDKTTAWDKTEDHSVAMSTR